MKLYILSIILSLLIFCSQSTNAMNSYSIHSNSTRDVRIILYDTIIDVQTPAEFPGGQDKWQDFLANNLDYDIAVKNEAPVGKYKVVFAFVIDTEGEIKDIRFVQNPGYGIAEEVLKALNKCPRWIPASQNGKNVIYRHRQELIFEVNQN